MRNLMFADTISAERLEEVKNYFLRKLEQQNCEVESRERYFKINFPHEGIGKKEVMIFLRTSGEIYAKEGKGFISGVFTKNAFNYCKTIGDTDARHETKESFYFFIKTEDKLKKLLTVLKAIIENNHNFNDCNLKGSN